MKVQNIFFGVGLVFAISTIIYFAYEYLFDLPKQVKLILLFLSSILLFLGAEYARGADK